MSAEDDLERVQAEMAFVAERHHWYMQEWHRLRAEQTRLRWIVEVERAKELREAQRMWGPDVRRSA